MDIKATEKLPQSYRNMSWLKCQPNSVKGVKITVFFIALYL